MTWLALEVTKSPPPANYGADPDYGAGFLFPHVWEESPGNI
jgi:hypothetical protein